MTNPLPDRLEEPSRVVPVRMDNELIARTQGMANDHYEGNFSMVLRRALRELLDREGYISAKEAIAS